MDKKVKFSDQPMKVKIVYAVVIGILAITAIVVGIVSVASRKDEAPDGGTNPPISDGDSSGENTDGSGSDNSGDTGNGSEGEGDKTPEKLTFVSPVVGSVNKYHSTDVPVFSTTLGEWRIHTGIDITAEEGAEVYAAADGTVTGVYSHPLLGKTVEITHAGGVVSVYSNLSGDGITVKEGDEIKSGAKIGLVGDSSLTELADESHLHFEVKVEGVSVNPLDYISEASKEASLGITEV